MTPPFNAADPSTWPAVLTMGHISQIYQRSVPAIQKALTPSSRRVFTPRPYKTRPYRWRRADVIRDTQAQSVAAAQDVHV